MIYGVDLGVRAIHVAGPDLAISLVIRDKMDRYTEIRALGTMISGFFQQGDLVFYEAPPLAGSRNLQTLIALSQTSGALLAASSGKCYEVPVATWKKEVVGKGNATKDDAAEWLQINDYPAYLQCHGDQNLIDACCIQKYGVLVINRVPSSM